MSRESSYDDLVEQLWVGLRVMVPLETRFVPYRSTHDVHLTAIYQVTLTLLCPC
jgi:hypothetical protein